MKLAPLKSTLKTAVARNALQLRPHKLADQRFAQGGGSSHGDRRLLGGGRDFAERKKAIQTLERRALCERPSRPNLRRG